MLNALTQAPDIIKQVFDILDLIVIRVTILAPAVFGAYFCSLNILEDRHSKELLAKRSASRNSS